MEKQENTKRQKQENSSKLGQVKEKSKISLAEPREMQKITDKTCKDIDCHLHGNLKVRGRFFEGRVTKKFPRRVVVEFERMIYVKKYERYAKSKTKIHARLSACLDSEIKVGDIIQVRECRPLSKIIHFAVIKKIKEGEKGK